MKMKNLKILVLILFLLGLKIEVSANSGTTSFQFLKVMTSARGTALSGAYCSIVNNSEAVFWNPAGLAQVNSFDASLSYVDWILDTRHISFSAAYYIEDFGTIGFQALAADMGDVEVTRADALGFRDGVYNPGLTGEVINPNSIVFGISYARNVTDKFSFGVTAKYAKEDLVYESTGAIIFEGGLVFKTGFKSINIGVAVRNFGPEIKFIDKSYPLPQTFDIGISSSLISSNDPMLLMSNLHNLIISYDMIQPRDYDQMHSVGMEYTYNDLLYLRGGYTFNSDQEGIAAGLGLKYNNYRIDYSYNDYGEYLNSIHRFTIGFEIN